MFTFGSVGPTENPNGGGARVPEVEADVNEEVSSAQGVNFVRMPFFSSSSNSA